MICPRCGANNPEEANVCAMCGFRLRGQNGMVGTLVQIAGSVPFLVLAIGYTVMVLFGLIGALGDSALVEMIRTYSAFLSMSGIPVKTVINVISITSKVLAVLNRLPNILMCVGLWLLFAGAKQYFRSSLGVNGLKCSGIYIVIQMVLVVFQLIGIVLLFIAAIFAAVQSWDYIDNMGLILALVGFVVLIAITAEVLVFKFYQLLRKIIKRLVNNLQGGSENVKIHSVVIILMYILGGSAVISALTNYKSVLLLLSYAGSAAATITAGILLSRLKNAAAASPAAAAAPVSSPAPVYQPVPPRPAPVPQPEVKTARNVPAAPQPAAPVPAKPASAPMPRCILIRRSTNERIPVTAPVFKLGRDRSMCDYAMPEKSSVSRCHAIVFYAHDRFYIGDNNSTNHVFLNGKPIKPGMKYPVENGTVFNVADEQFIIMIG